MESSPLRARFSARLSTGSALGRRRRRRGVLTVELVLTLPILLAVLVAIVLFSQLLLSGQAIDAAANVATREATLPGATEARVQQVVRQALDGWRFAGAIDDLVIEINGSPQPLAAAQTGDAVSVRVSVDAIDAVPDMLAMFGVSIADMKLRGRYVMRKE